MSQTSYEATNEEIAIIKQIAKRAVRLYAAAGVNLDLLDVMMGVTVTHANGCRLGLRRLLAADDFNFAHDITGISRHLNRATGKLQECFQPRFAA